MQAKTDTALFEAVMAGDVPQAEAALAQGANIEAKNEHTYETPLIMAARMRQEDMGLWLLEKGADANAISMTKHSALIYASKHSPRLAIALLDGGANPDFRHADRVNVPLVNAAKEGLDEVVFAMLEKGAKPNVADNARVSPAVAASMWGSRNAFEALVEAGANLNMIDSYGESELQKPYKLAYRELMPEQRCNSVLMLLSAGASMTQIGRDSSLHYVAKTYRKELLAMTERMMAAPLPSEESFASATKESLLAEEGSLLDHPQTWRYFGALQERLENKLEPLTREDLQGHIAPDGNSYLEFAVRCVGLENWQEMAVPYNLEIRPADLVSPDGSASTLLHNLSQQKDLNLLCGQVFWEKSTVQEMRRVFDALPEESRGALPVHTLLAAKRLSEHNNERGR